MIGSKHITEKALEFVKAFQSADMDDLWEAARSLEPEHDTKPLALTERDAYVMLEALANEREERWRAAVKAKRIADDHGCCDDHD